MSKEDANIKQAWKNAYQAYILQLSPPKSRFSNRYNLFYNVNYWDRRWFKRVHKMLADRGLSLRSN